MYYRYYFSLFNENVLEKLLKKIKIKNHPKILYKIKITMKYTIKHDCYLLTTEKYAK